MIPKIIHYCWFGDNPKSKLIIKCIDSWKKYLPDYQIIEWNESNFNINICQYVEQAYKAKKWAFVSDYARFWALNNYGGIYLDTDVELIKDPRRILKDRSVALEDANSIATGLLMCCQKEDEFCKYMLSSYNSDSFILKDGSYNLKTVCERTTEYFDLFGFIREDRNQYVSGYTIFSTEYFCPYKRDREEHFTDDTYSIHHYAASWLPWNVKLKRSIQKFIGKRGTEFIVQLKKGLRGYGKKGT